MRSDGTLENLNIETGDFSLFPLDYVNGTAPQQENEIALSFLNAREMEKADWRYRHTRHRGAGTRDGGQRYLSGHNQWRQNS